ncbi:MAG TPA: hypothetical protein VHT53_08380 [Candidatus Elarobacter sp.]|jgi:hypothetical protein|nr:hypothetical protein [Candidatus Elarobacter sp.]
MKYLIYCVCGHGLDKHAFGGCSGDGRMPCRCRRDQEAALDSAIDDARSHPWGSTQYAAPPEAAEVRA